MEKQITIKHNKKEYSIKLNIDILSIVDISTNYGEKNYGNYGMMKNKSNRYPNSIENVRKQLKSDIEYKINKYFDNLEI